jgi:hypothetical protein
MQIQTISAGTSGCEHVFDAIMVQSPRKGGDVDSKGVDASDLTTRVQQLRPQARDYRDRYGNLEDLVPLDRLDHAIGTRLARIKHLR